MSTSVLPTLPPVGGYITQQVLTSLPADDPSTKYRSHSFKQRKFSPKGFSPTSSGGKLIEKIDTAAYRNSFFHNLCLKMLEAGYHHAFSELFNLIRDEMRSAEGEDHLGHTKISIDEHEDKLNLMKEKLIAAEIARRQGRMDQVYEAQVSLAQFFDTTKDFRLAEKMYQVAYKTSCQVRGDGRRKEAEANRNLAQTAERKKNYVKAKRLYEEFHSLSFNKNFQLPDGTSLHQVACDCLKRVYIILSSQLPIENEEDVMQYLHQAYNIAKEGGNRNEVGKVGYLIGNKYDQYGKQELAVKYHNEFLEICKTTKDDLGMGKACQALAYANQRQGNMEAALSNLKMFLQVSERSGDVDSRREACRDLGALYNSIGNHVQSASYLKKAFDLSCQNEQDTEHQDSASCEYAVSLAHGLLTGCVENVSQCDRGNLQKLLHWKSERLQSFSGDSRTYSMFSRQNSVGVSSFKRNGKKESKGL